jgi:hypothetical protein
MPAWLVPVLSAGAFLGAIVTAVMTAIGWRKQRELADRQAGHQRELAERQAERSTFASRELENVKAELTSQLEGVKVELATFSRLRTTAEEKRAQVAAEALVSVIRIIGLLRSVCAVYLSFEAHDVDASAVDLITRDRQERWNAVREFEPKFVEAWTLAQVYLPESTNGLLERIWFLRREIDAAQTRWEWTVAEKMDARFVSTNEEQGFGDIPEAKLDAALAEAKTLLRPVAQLAATATPSKGLA